MPDFGGELRDSALRPVAGRHDAIPGAHERTPDGMAHIARADHCHRPFLRRHCLRPVMFRAYNPLRS